MEGIRIGEDAVLKTVELKGFGGSSPSPSANCQVLEKVISVMARQTISSCLGEGDKEIG